VLFRSPKRTAGYGFRIQCRIGQPYTTGKAYSPRGLVSPGASLLNRRDTVRVNSQDDMQRGCKRGIVYGWIGGRCTQRDRRGKTKFIGIVMIPAFPVCNRNERPNRPLGKGLERGGKGRQHAQYPPFPPRAITDYCHIHPWIFSPL
jgi:hypothetical protein